MDTTKKTNGDNLITYKVVAYSACSLLAGMIIYLSSSTLADVSYNKLSVKVIQANITSIDLTLKKFEERLEKIEDRLTDTGK